LLPEIHHLAGAAPSKRSGEHGEIICYQYLNTSRDTTVANAELPICTALPVPLKHGTGFSFDKPGS